MNTHQILSSLVTPSSMILMLLASLLVSLAILACLKFGKRWSAAQRFTVWQVALVALLLIPLAALALPKVPLGWQFAKLSETELTEEAETVESTPASSQGDRIKDTQDAFAESDTQRNGVAPALPFTTKRSSSVPQLSSGNLKGSDSTSGSPAETFQSDSISANGEIRETTPAIYWPIFKRWLVPIWAGITLFLLLRLFNGYRRTIRIAGQATKLKIEAIKSIEQWSTAPLLSSSEVSIPVTVGVWRPVIILPPESEGWDGQKLEMIVRHELAHVKRRDVMWQLLAEIACRIYWFQPLLWKCHKRMQLDREQACDDRVIRGGTVATDYATALLQIAAELSGKGPQLVGAIPVARKPLETRLRSILNPATVRIVTQPWFIAIATVLFAGLAAAIATVRPFDPIPDGPLPAVEDSIETNDLAQENEDQQTNMRGHTMVGKVLDHTGEPVEGAEVTFQFTAHNTTGTGLNMDDQQTLKAKTDWTGRYSIDTTDVKFTGPGYAGHGFVIADGQPRTRIQYIPEPDEGGFIKLPDATFLEARVLKGTVVPPEGEMADPDSVRIRVAGILPNERIPWADTFDVSETGEFDIAVPKDAQLGMAVSAANYAGPTFQVADKNGELGAIELSKGVTVSGTVTGNNGKPAAGVVVTIRNTSKTVVEHKASTRLTRVARAVSTKTDKDGNYKLPPQLGEFHIQLSRFGHDHNGDQVHTNDDIPIALPQLLQLTNDQSAIQVDFKQEETYSIAGQILWPDGTPAKSVPVTAQVGIPGCNLQTDVTETTTNGHGQYTVRIPRGHSSVSLMSRATKSKDGKNFYAYALRDRTEQEEFTHAGRNGFFMQPAIEKDMMDWDWVMKPVKAHWTSPKSPTTRDGSQKSADEDVKQQRIVGRILDHEGAPVADAEISLNLFALEETTEYRLDLDRRTQVKIRTNSKGQYSHSLKDFPFESVGCNGMGKIHAKGHPISGIHMLPKPDSSGIIRVADIKLLKGRVIKGMVAAPPEAELPPKDVFLIVQGYPPEAAFGLWKEYYAVDSAEGTFEISVPADCPIVISAIAGNYFGSSVRADGDDLVSIRLRNGSSVTGTVTDKDGNPVEGAVVNIRTNDSRIIIPTPPRDGLSYLNTFGELQASAQTDGNGQYQLPPFAGKCEITVSRFGYALDGQQIWGSMPPIISPVVLEIEEVLESVKLDLAEAETFLISGEITWPDGSPAHSVSVTASVMADNGLTYTQVNEAKTNRLGQYEVSVPRKHKHVSISVLGSKNSDGKFYPASPETDYPTLQKSNQLVAFDAIEDDLGDVNWRLIPYQLQSERQEEDSETKDTPTNQESIQENEPKPATIKLPSTLTGKVVDHAGEPIADAEIILKARRTVKNGVSIDVKDDVRLRVVKTDLGGEFSIDTGELEMETKSIRISGYIKGDHVVEKRIFQQIKSNNHEGYLGEFKTEQGRRVTGKLIGKDGNAAENAFVQFGARGVAGTFAEDLFWYGSFIPCKADGSFTAMIPAECDVEMIVRSSNYSSTRVSIPLTAEDLGEIQLKTGSQVIGQVTDEDGEGVSGVVVSISSTEYKDHSELFRRGFMFPIRNNVLTDAKGNFRLPPMLGDCVVTIIPHDSGPTGEPIHCQQEPPVTMPQKADLDGSEPEVTIDIPAAETVAISGTIRFEDGTPAANVLIQGDGFCRRLSSNILRYASSDAEGKYTIELPKRVSFGSILSYGYNDGEKRFRVKPVEIDKQKWSRLGIEVEQDDHSISFDPGEAGEARLTPGPPATILRGSGLVDIDGLDWTVSPVESEK